MAKHETHKSTTDGKHLTTSRRANRARKYRPTHLDVDALLRDLHDEQAARRLAAEVADLTTN